MMTTTGPKEEHNEQLMALRREIERKTGKTPEQLYEEREKRARDAINQGIRKVLGESEARITYN
jgi:hypothetical protein